MKTVFSFVKPYKRPALFAFALMLLELSVELIQPIIMAKMINDGVLQRDTSVILQWGSLLFVLSLIAVVSGIVNSYFSSHTAQSFSFDLRNALFQKIQSLNMSAYSKFSTASLITRLTSDVSQVQLVVYMSLRILFRAPLMVIGSIIMAFIVDARLALMLVIGTPFLAVFLGFMAIRGVRLFAGVQKRLDRVNRVLQENLQAVRLVKAYLRGGYENNRFEQVSKTLKIDTVKVMRLMESIQPTLLLVMHLSLLAVLWFGFKQIQGNDAAIGELVAIINYAMRITGSFSMFSFLLVILAKAKASAGRMEEILVANEMLEQIAPLSTNKVETNKTAGTIVFDDVSFYYPDSNKYVLQNISFQIGAGEKLAIMGATGAGKSTLLHLIPRFYEVTDGHIYVNGQDILHWNLADLRQTIGFVPQQSLLFTGSIAENIRWGKEQATSQEIEQAIEQAQISESIERFPDRYETRVGQKGVNLSGGQKQRLSIARALVRQSSILILDDSTSALDVKTESALWQALAEEQVTMLVVTQKILTAKGADRILLLDEGQMAGFGTHEQLLKESALYRKIAASQQGGEVS